MQTKECWSADRESFNYATMREMIEGELDRLRVGGSVWRGTAVVIEPATILPAAAVAGIALAGAERELGEHADLFLTITEQARAELQELLNGWLAKHSSGRTAYSVVSATQYVLKRSDFTDDELEILDEVETLSK